MKLRNLFVLLLFTCGLAVAAHHEEEAIGEVLDDFHDAAAHGDKARYLGHMTDDAVFMGTDEWERWPKHPDFVEYVDGRFKDGTGWSYRSVERELSVADSGDVAWFDEVVYSETNGRFRGTGVLVKQDGAWKIAHYAMSFLIFNENWQDVVELTRKTRAGKEAGER
jgi:ketosteroid isomerase-like protein